MNETVPAYGLWSLVIVNSAVFIFFAFSFVKPKTSLDWRSLGAFSAFIVAMFATVMTGFLLMWPTLLTLLMFPVLIVVYIRLARREEAMVREEFGDEYDRYAAAVPAFIPRVRYVRE